MSSEPDGKGGERGTILHVGLDLVPSSGGSVTAVRDFMLAAPSMVISFTSPGKLRAERSAITDTLHVETARGFFGRFFAWAPQRNLRQANAAAQQAGLIVCHILLRYHVHWIKAIAGRRKVPYWVVPHGCLDPYVFTYRSWVKRIWFSLFGRSFLKKAQYVIFATQRERQKARRYYDGSNCHVVHWPVEAPDISRRELIRERVRRTYGISSHERVMIFVGRLHSLKRPLETIRAFAMAQPKDTHLLMVGPEETFTREDCLDLAARLGVRKVHVTGPVYRDLKDEHLIASDVYISLSHRENFGYSAAEALAAGLPVILSPGNDLSAELQVVRCGWMLGDDSLETAAAAIREFSTCDSERLAEMGGRGRKWVMKELSFAKFAERVNSLRENVPGSDEVRS